ncbi:MAG TPA: glycosyltransferase, partial [Gemmatimonadales bacterium]|nr:glycosyltransferase [Gemmatimonadales bacterium]
MSAARLALVIPAWNEARRLEDAAFLAFVRGQDVVDLHFVDDGSRDETPARLAALAAAAPGRIRVQRLAANRGKAEAVRTGLAAAIAEGYPLVGYLDADLAAPLDTAMLLRNVLIEMPAVSMVLGSRVKLLGWRIRRSEKRHYLGRVFATFASMALDLPVYDTQCGAKAMRASPALAAALEAPFLSRWLFDVELIARLRDALGVDALRELPLPRWEDPGGSSVGLKDF